MAMDDNMAFTIESPEVVAEIKRLIDSGINAIDIDYDEIVYQAELKKAKEFYGD
jgi:hypothetical protein